MELLRRPGFPPAAAGGPVEIAPDGVDWHFIHFNAYHLKAGDVHRGDSEDRETGLIVLGGRCSVRAGELELTGIGTRRDVWERIPPAVVLMPPGTAYEIVAESEVHLVVTGARSDVGFPPRLIAASEIAVEHRGEGQTARYIHHLLPGSAEAARLLLVEVYTPAGNWSSFPPHKHDTEDPPRESYLEEVYYYQIRPAQGFAFQRVYTVDGRLDETVAAKDGDLVLVPRGYHVVAAMPGHDCYYLNVMAGPTRAWNFQVDPDYASLLNWQKPAVTDAKKT